MKYSLPLDVLSFRADSHRPIDGHQVPITLPLAAFGEAAWMLRAAAVALVLAMGLVSPARAWNPYYGIPAPLPGTFEAEDFDLGGETAGYHDNTPGNQGGQYRPTEDVDIIASTDSAGGGYVVNNFESGEWLAYTVNVATSGLYDIELRASTHADFPNRAYHLEVDGFSFNVTGPVVLPDTGGWTSFQWVGRRTVFLSAGVHLLKIFSDQQYFNLNSVRVTSTSLGASRPFYGTPVSLPGTFEAEDFDLGGESVAYHDITSGNQGGKDRLTEDVDIIDSSDPAGGGFVVTYNATGEWLNYTVNVQASGQYNIEIRAASAATNSAFRILIDGVDVTGTIAVPNTGSWNAFQWVGKQGVFISGGQHVLTLVVDHEYFDLNALRVSAASTSSPFFGTPISLPGTFEAEDFDLGGEGVAYHDNTPANQGGQYRPAEAVDIITSSDAAGGGFVVAYNETGEWLNYTVNVQASGQYDIEVRAGSPAWNSAFHIEIDGVDVTGSITVPNTGSWNTFQWVGKQGVPLAAGRHVLKIFVDQQYFDFNAIRVVAISAPPGTRIEDNDPAVSYTPSGAWIFLTDSRATNNTATESQIPGARATLSFTGTEVRWIGYHYSGGGIARVFVDGTFVGEADQYAPTEMLQPVSFAATGLARGAHTLSIEVTGTKHPESTNTWIVIDAFDVTP